MNKNSSGYLVQDIGLIVLLISVFTGAMTVSYTEKSFMNEAVILLLGIFFVILLAGFRLTSLSAVFAGMEVTFYTAYKLYQFLSYDTEITIDTFVWIIIPFTSLAGMHLFVYGNRKLELENDILRTQVEELVVVDPLTRLYNLRSLYNDLNVLVSYVERNNMSLSLMIIVLKYESELKSILSRRHYEQVIQRLAELVVDVVRAEDKTYSIDQKGSLAVILTCDKEGSEIAMRRIKNRISEREAFNKITDEAIKIEVKMASLEYKKELFGDNMILFKQRVENELQYDV